uniref:YxiE n=1 Tax=Salmo salar TaxID=8030 RepID=B9EPF7_SALSA|nr:YXIE protein [Salmo salar]ACM09404.1 yxiE precursor [Salmo salar]
MADEAADPNPPKTNTDGKVDTIEHFQGDENDPANDPNNKKYTRRIVIPMDGSGCGNRALEIYMSIFHQPNDYVVLVHIHQPPTLSGLSLAAAPTLYMSHEYRKSVEDSVVKCQKYGQQLKQQAINLGLKFKIVLATVQGRGCGDTILSIAKEYDPSLIIIGSRGLGTFSRFMLGSTSDFLVHHSELPVCVVPPAQHSSK